MNKYQNKINKLIANKVKLVHYKQQPRKENNYLKNFIMR